MTRSLLPTHSDVRAAFPRGVATARELVAFGFSERTVYKRCLDGGPWQRILPGVILLFTGRPTRDQQVLAAVLLCGPGCVVTGVEACRRLGLRRGLPPAPVDGGYAEVHVLLPDSRQVRCCSYVKTERTGRMPTAVSRGGFLLAPLPRACLDAARCMTRRGDVAELLSDPVQRGLCTVAELASELTSGSRRGIALPGQVLADLRAGVRSAAEQEARRMWRGTGLPEPMWNATVRDARGAVLGVADCWLDDVAMAWEIESGEWHMSPADHDRTVERAARFTAAGVVYTATKPRRVRLDRAGVVATLRATYAQAKARPRPPLHATPADAG